MQLGNLLNTIAAGVFAGTLFWLLMWPLVRVTPLLRLKGVFPELVLNGCAEQAREALHLASRELAMLTGAACAAVAAFLALLFMETPVSFGVLSYVLFAIACLLTVAWGVFAVRGLRRWWQYRFAARADAALGAVLGRVAMAGHRVFHDVSLGNERFEHVVVGPRGIFVVRVVARRAVKQARAVRLNGRTLEFQDGKVLADPIVSVERGARLLAELVERSLSHRVAVRPVVAVPGWEVAPAHGTELLLVNEKNALMLPGWSRPADHVFEEDLPALQERLARLSVNRGL